MLDAFLWLYKKLNAQKRNVDRALNVNSRYYKANEFTVFLEVS